MYKWVLNYISQKSRIPSEPKVYIYQINAGNVTSRIEEFISKLDTLPIYNIIVECENSKDVSKCLDELDPNRKFLMASKHLFE